MQRLLILLSLLAFELPLAAQPWQWQPGPDDFYNPDGFPRPQQLPGSVVAVGDIDGDGHDDYLELSNTAFLVARRDPASLHWSVSTGEHDFHGNGLVAAYMRDMDGGGGDELILFTGTGMHAWQVTATDPWTFENRDDLLSDFFNFPLFVQRAIWRDFDGDGRMNLLLWQHNASHLLVMFERDNTGQYWHIDSLLMTAGLEVGGLQENDFDNDGDRDFLVLPPAGSPVGLRGIGENCGDHLEMHRNTPWDPVLFGSNGSGGDLDGDGAWEALLTDSAVGPGGVYLNYWQVDVVADDDTFVRPVGARQLGPLEGPVLGRVRIGGRDALIVVRNPAAPHGNGDTGGFGVWARRPDEWQAVANGFGYAADWRCTGGTLADLDADGRIDLLATLQDDDDNLPARHRWSLWQNVAGVEADSFVEAAALTSFSHHPDSLFTSPCIGNVGGSARAELALLLLPVGDEPVVVFYELEGTLTDPAFAARPAWNFSAPGTDRITLADLDGNGISELIARQSGVWQAYFRYGDAWIWEPDVLPVLTAEQIAFADADGDGDVDLFTPTAVWISASPSPAVSPDGPLPADYALSAYPNPFNAQTQLRFTLPRAGRATLELFNTLGQRVAVLHDGLCAAGEHTRPMDAAALPSGIYLVRLNAAGHSQTLKLALLK